MSAYDRLLLDKAKEFYLKKVQLIESLDKHLSQKGNLSKAQQDLLRKLINDNTYSKK
jgi:hypothetical protein